MNRRLSEVLEERLTRPCRADGGSTLRAIAAPRAIRPVAARGASGRRADSVLSARGLVRTYPSSSALPTWPGRGSVVPRGREAEAGEDSQEVARCVDFHEELGDTGRRSPGVGAELFADIRDRQHFRVEL